MPPFLGCASCPRVIVLVPPIEEVVCGVDGVDRTGGASTRVDELANATNGRSKPSIAKTGPHSVSFDIDTSPYFTSVDYKVFDLLA